MPPQSVSVVVPVYNQARYLPACLDALWFQEYPELEVLVVDDGSTDGAAEVLADYARALAGDTASFASHFDATRNVIERASHPRYPRKGRRFRVLTHEKNRGLAAALNTGFAAATGAYCTYIPADDVAVPSMIGELAAALSAGADFAYADMAIVDDAGRWLRRFSLPDYSFERSFGDWYLCGVAKLYRRGLHDRYGFYDENLLAHDHELFLRFAEAGARFVHLPRVLLYVRDHGRREVDIHAPESWNRLLEESKGLVLRARAHAAGQEEKESEG